MEANAVLSKPLTLLWPVWLEQVRLKSYQLELR
jgi:hypothetical protein